MKPDGSWGRALVTVTMVALNVAFLLLFLRPTHSRQDSRSTYQIRLTLGRFAVRAAVAEAKEAAHLFQRRRPLYENIAVSLNACRSDTGDQTQDGNGSNSSNGSTGADGSNGRSRDRQGKGAQKGPAAIEMNPVRHAIELNPVRDGETSSAGDGGRSTIRAAMVV